jgi:hypothetical protein
MNLRIVGSIYKIVWWLVFEQVIWETEVQQKMSLQFSILFNFFQKKPKQMYTFFVLISYF